MRKSPFLDLYLSFPAFYPPGCSLVVIDPLLKSVSGKNAIISVGLSVLAAILIFSFTYKLPPFPEKHELNITVLIGKTTRFRGIPVWK